MGTQRPSPSARKGCTGRGLSRTAGGDTVDAKRQSGDTIILIVLLGVCIAAICLALLLPVVIRERIGCSGCLVVAIVASLIGVGVTIAMMQ